MSAPPRPSDPIRVRLRAELRRLKISGAELGRRMTTRTGQTWYPNRVSKLLNGYGDDVIFRVDDLVLICEVCGISLVEVVRDPDRPLAELTPDEHKFLQAFRADPEYRALFVQILQRPPRLRPARTRLPQSGTE